MNISERLLAEENRAPARHGVQRQDKSATPHSQVWLAMFVGAMGNSICRRSGPEEVDLPTSLLMFHLGKPPPSAIVPRQRQQGDSLEAVREAAV